MVTLMPYNYAAQRCGLIDKMIEPKVKKMNCIKEKMEWEIERGRKTLIEALKVSRLLVEELKDQQQISQSLKTATNLQACGFFAVASTDISSCCCCCHVLLWFVFVASPPDWEMEEAEIAELLKHFSETMNEVKTLNGVF